MPEHSGSCDREALKRRIVILEEAERVLRLEAQARQKLDGPGVIMVSSLISHRNQKPRIDIQVGEIHTQMPVDAAMQFAIHVIRCCSGSFADGFIFHFMKERVGLDDARGAQIIEDFRAYRQELEEEFQKDQKEGI
jgi:hypothetical protein